MNTIENRENLYVFIDESGNFGFEYENNDNTYYDMIKKYIFSEFDIFKLGYYFYCIFAIFCLQTPFDVVYRSWFRSYVFL